MPNLENILAAKTGTLIGTETGIENAKRTFVDKQSRPNLQRMTQQRRQPRLTPMLTDRKFWALGFVAMCQKLPFRRIPPKLHGGTCAANAADRKEPICECN